MAGEWNTARGWVKGIFRNFRLTAAPILPKIPPVAHTAPRISAMKTEQEQATAPRPRIGAAVVIKFTEPVGVVTAVMDDPIASGEKMYRVAVWCSASEIREVPLGR
jgi:hypothetical protein